MKQPPVVGRYKVIPLIQERASVESWPHQAEPELQQALGYPATLVDNWQEKAIAKLGELVQSNRALRLFFDTCTKCGACTDKCHFFLGTHDPKNMPVARQDLLRQVYRRYFTFFGKHFPWWVGARDLDEDVLNEWYSYFHQCSECRRCTVFCPKGIDTSEVSMAGREILASIGLGQHYTSEVINKVHQIGNNMGLKKPALQNTLEELEEDIFDETGIAVKLPLDDATADTLLVTPSADFFAEPHIDGLIGYAKVLHVAGIHWTFSSKASEAANFGLFNGSQSDMQAIALRIRVAALELGVKRIIIGECGHAWRVAYSFWETLIGPFNFLDARYPRPQHICEVTYELLQSRKITLDPSRNAGKVVTYHDSCNVARGASMGDQPGGQFSIPRALLRASCDTYVDMSGDTVKQQTFCCGGGGGLLTDELMPLRVQGALPRAQALQAVVDSHQVTHMVAICAICKTQFSAVLPQHELEGVEVLSLHQLVGNALVMEP